MICQNRDDEECQWCRDLVEILRSENRCIIVAMATTWMRLKCVAESFSPSLYRLHHIHSFFFSFKLQFSPHIIFFIQPPREMKQDNLNIERRLLFLFSTAFYYYRFHRFSISLKNGERRRRHRWNENKKNIFPQLKENFLSLTHQDNKFPFETSD